MSPQPAFHYERTNVEQWTKNETTPYQNVYPQLQVTGRAS